MGGLLRDSAVLSDDSLSSLFEPPSCLAVTVRRNAARMNIDEVFSSCYSLYVEL